MKLGKRERALRKERMRWLEQCRLRHARVMNPGMDEAASSVSNPLDSHLGDFRVPNSRHPRVGAGWNSSSARSSAQGSARVYR